MNGVHCQISSTITDGQRELTDPVHLADAHQREHPVQDAVASGRGSSVFQISAAATGVMRNGVISSVRTTPRAEERPVQQQRQQQAQERRDQHHTDDQDDGVERHRPERGCP